MMEIEIKVTQQELDEVSATTSELKEMVIDDLDRGRDYPGFNVRVVVISKATGE